MKRVPWQGAAAGVLTGIMSGCLISKGCSLAHLVGPFRFHMLKSASIIGSVVGISVSLSDFLKERKFSLFPWNATKVQAEVITES